MFSTALIQLVCGWYSFTHSAIWGPLLIAGGISARVLSTVLSSAPSCDCANACLKLGKNKASALLAWVLSLQPCNALDNMPAPHCPFKLGGERKVNSALTAVFPVVPDVPLECQNWLYFLQIPPFIKIASFYLCSKVCLLHVPVCHLPFCPLHGCCVNELPPSLDDITRLGYQQDMGGAITHDLHQLSEVRLSINTQQHQVPPSFCLPTLPSLSLSISSSPSPISVSLPLQPYAGKSLLPQPWWPFASPGLWSQSQPPEPDHQHAISNLVLCARWITCCSWCYCNYYLHDNFVGFAMCDDIWFYHCYCIRFMGRNLTQKSCCFSIVINHI